MQYKLKGVVTLTELFPLLALSPWGEKFENHEKSLKLRKVCKVMSPDMFWAKQRCSKRPRARGWSGRDHRGGRQHRGGRWRWPVEARQRCWWQKGWAEFTDPPWGGCETWQSNGKNGEGQRKRLLGLMKGNDVYLNVFSCADLSATLFYGQSSRKQPFFLYLFSSLFQIDETRVRGTSQKWQFVMCFKKLLSA